MFWQASTGTKKKPGMKSRYEIWLRLLCMVAQGKTSRSDRVRMEWKGLKLTSYRPNYLIDEEAED